MQILVKILARILAYVLLAVFCLCTGDLYAWQLRLQNATDQSLVFVEYGGEVFGVGAGETREYRVARPRLVFFYIRRIDPVSGNLQPVNIDNTGQSSSAWVDQDLTDTQGRYIRVTPQTFYGPLPHCQVFENGYTATPSGAEPTIAGLHWGYHLTAIALVLMTAAGLLVGLKIAQSKP